MGDIISISCHDCGWGDGGCTGHGFRTLVNYDEIKDNLPKSFIRKLDKEKFIGFVSTPGVIIVCSNCSNIGFRTHYEAQGIKAEHRCGRCRSKAEIIDNPETLEFCPECGKATLNVEYMGIWD